MRTSTHTLDAEGRPVATRTATEPEWDPIESAIMIAAAALDKDRCPGCGGWLSETVTTLPPMDDQPDHGHRVHKSWCRDCVALSKFEAAQAKQDEQLRGTLADEYPAARRIRLEHIPID
ncbi:hypothetical protein ACQCX2_17515 [Propionibacteriaceae bacterium Y1700]|uniref:hypothetical protein n=1 Tax=Microlunatus sp. Y1700 TaxID=3418487 RepID=UPI003DA76385